MRALVPSFCLLFACTSADPSPSSGLDAAGTDVFADSSETEPTDSAATDGPDAGETLPATSAPRLTPMPGSYATPLRVELASDTPGAAIYFTTNGETPTASSTKYDGKKVALANSATIKALALAAGHAASVVVSGKYEIAVGGSVGAVTFMPAEGGYAGDQSVTLSTPSTSAFICFAFAPKIPNCDATDPDDGKCIDAEKYTSPVVVKPTASGTTLRALACAWGYGNSSTTKATYSSL